jgi:hypothetical protein
MLWKSEQAGLLDLLQSEQAGVLRALQSEQRLPLLQRVLGSVGPLPNSCSSPQCAPAEEGNSNPPGVTQLLGMQRVTRNTADLPAVQRCACCCSSTHGSF